MNKCIFCLNSSVQCAACSVVQQIASNAMPKVLLDQVAIRESLVIARKRLCDSYGMPLAAVEEWMVGPNGWWTVFVPPTEKIQYVGYSPFGSYDVYLMKWLGMLEITVNLAAPTSEPMG